MMILLRILTPILLLALGLGHFYLVGYPEQQVQKVEPEARQVSIEPLPLSVHCPGAFVQVGGQSGTDLGLVERLGEARISVAHSSELEVAPELATTGLQSAVAAGSEQSTQLLSMLQAQAVDQERASGLQASYCPQAASSGWVANGFSVAGAESVLILANPSAVEALVNLEIHLPQEVVTDQLALAPGEEQLLSLARYANGEELFAVHFDTNGPEVLVAMQNRMTRGLTPIGVELEVAGSEPSQQHEFVGLRELTGGFTLPELRVYNTTANATEVIVNALDGLNVELFRIQVPAFGFEKLELNLSDRYQLITVESAEPVLAAIKSMTIDPTIDFAWVQPADRFRTLTLPLTRYQNSLVLANPDSAAVEITLSVTSGSRTSVQSLILPALGTISIPVNGESLRVEAQGDFIAALEILDRVGYSIITPRENANLGNNLTILTR